MLLAFLPDGSNVHLCAGHETHDAMSRPVLDRLGHGGGHVSPGGSPQMGCDRFKLDAHAAHLHLVVGAPKVVKDVLLVALGEIAGKTPSLAVEDWKARCSDIRSTEVASRQLWPESANSTFLSRERNRSLPSTVTASVPGKSRSMATVPSNGATELPQSERNYPYVP
jgi:hypothetical protein